MADNKLTEQDEMVALDTATAVLRLAALIANRRGKSLHTGMLFVGALRGVTDVVEMMILSEWIRTNDDLDGTLGLANLAADRIRSMFDKIDDERRRLNADDAQAGN